jgi:uncharacterized protein DUF87
MENKISLNENIFIDLPTLLKTRLLVQANSGGGKSWLIRRILEQSQGKVQQIVIDLEGEFASLREQFDYILVGSEGDTPANPSSANLLARKLLELNVSTIIDVYELPLKERRRFVRLFLEGMIHSPKDLWHPCLVVIDEAHVFCPEKDQSESADAVISMATLGRKRGFSVILATQRISKLHKDAAAECNNKLIGRTNLDIDIRRSAEELGITAKEKKLTLQNLEAGEFYAFGPAISRAVIKVKVGSVQTSHHEAGTLGFSSKPAPPTARIKKLLSALQNLPKEAEQEAKTIADYQRQISELKNQLKSNRKNQGTEMSIPSKVTIAAAVTQALKTQKAQFKKEKEQLVLYADALRIRLKIIQDDLRKFIDEPLPDLPNIASLNGNDTGIPLATKREVEKQGKKEAPGQPVHNGLARNNQNEIVVKWLEKLDDRPREMFTYIVSAYPQTITRKELGITEFSKINVQVIHALIIAHE